MTELVSAHTLTWTHDAKTRYVHPALAEGGWTRYVGRRSGAQSSWGTSPWRTVMERVRLMNIRLGEMPLARRRKPEPPHVLRAA